MVALVVAAAGGGGYAAVAAGSVNAAKFIGPHQFLPGDSPDIQYAGIGIGSLVCTGSTFTEGSAAAFDGYVELPDGARITKVVYYYTDNNATADLTFHLAATTVVNNDTLADDLVGPVSSTGASATATNIALTPASPTAVDNAHQDVFLSVEFGQGGCFPPGERTDLLVFHGARVFYRR